MLWSQLCTRASLTTPALRTWSERLRPMWDPDGTDSRPVMVHRKMWEWLFIAEALAGRGVLAPGRRGLGFGVGCEPLVALFAAQGCRIVATDLDPDRAREAGWTQTGQEYAHGLGGLNQHGLCPAADFERLVTYRDVDMTAVPADLEGFDFTWSSCALEHLGSLEAGARFVIEQMRCLAPGGVAVHTTECNVSSDDDTVDTGATVLYRRRDLEELARRLRHLGYRTHGDLTGGDTPDDLHVDVPPFSDVHLRTTLGAFVTTSVGLVVEKPVDWTAPTDSPGRRAGGRRWWSRRAGAPGQGR